MRKALSVALILLTAAVLLFCGLTHRPLWQDEAETACLGRNVVRFGAPVAFDGVNRISQEQRAEADEDQLWRWSPWLQIYLSAASQKLLGSTTLAARLPFALFGLLAVGLTFWLVWLRFADFRWALCAAYVLSVSVPYLLYVRQGRYYGLGAALSVGCVAFLLGDWRKWTAPVGVAVCLGLLFHLNYLLFGSLALALAVGVRLCYPGRVPWRSGVLSACLTAAIALPGLFWYKIGSQGGMIRLDMYADSLARYANQGLLFLLPLPVVAYLAWRAFARRVSLSPELDDRERFVVFCAVVLGVSALVLSLAPQQFFRYLVHLFPLAAVIVSWACLRAFALGVVPGGLLLAMVSLTNWLHVIPLERAWRVDVSYDNTFMQLSWPNIPLQLYLAEAACPEPDVNAALVEFFNRNAKNGDLIFVEYNDLVLQFHTPFHVVGALQGEVGSDRTPDWVWNKRSMMLDRDGGRFLATRRLEALELKDRYAPRPVPGSDETYENTGDALTYHFLPSPGARELIVHERRDR